MTLEEAIEHAEKVAEENEKISLYTPVEFISADVSIEQCQKCADDHRQLAEWLRELQERRKMPEIIRCKDCVYALTCNRKIDFGSGLFFTVSSCSMAGRRTDENNNLHV